MEPLLKFSPVMLHLSPATIRNLNENPVLIIDKLRTISYGYTLISHGNDVKMFKTQEEPQAAGEWFHCKAG